MHFQDADTTMINTALEKAWSAFTQYRNFTLARRAEFMYAIAEEMDKDADQLVEAAMKETNLPEARLRNERIRTVFQLRSYADHAKSGHWLDVRIDTADNNRNPPKPDLRKTSVPLGPVVVFGASNFPFAYSTAGGDTACAFAAGCPVIVKAHPGHPVTSELVAKCIMRAAQRSEMPEGIFSHIHGRSFEVGKALVTHPRTCAVGFTGSYTGGRALFDWAAERKSPIPVFAEMGSTNPVFLLPKKLESDAAGIAKQLANSITLGVGQFCTNPGLMIAQEGAGLDAFIIELSNSIRNIPGGKMLHEGIAKGYDERKQRALQQDGVTTIAETSVETEAQGKPVIATASAEAFHNNPVLHEEVFGPYSLIIRCRDKAEMTSVAAHFEGQLTATIYATDEELKEAMDLVDSVRQICGRLNFNGVPTGVEVALAMHHGGPFPSTTDSRFTSVGGDGIKRFVRPLSYQNWPDSLLPEELRDENPLQIFRTVNNKLTIDAVKRSQ
jgi:2,5-dioxopentanoate dehydrogenase